MTNFKAGDVSGSQVLVDATTGTSDHLYADFFNELRQSRGPTAVVGTTEQCEYYCDGDKDEVQIQAAIDSLGTTGGTVHIKAGTYIVENLTTLSNGQLTFIGVPYGVIIEGEGSSTIIKVKDGAIAAGTGTRAVFWIGKTGSTDDFTFRDLVIDGNGIGQDFTTAPQQNFHGGIFGLSGAGSTHQMLRTLVLDNVTMKNFVMSDTGTYKNGMPLNTYGMLFVQISNCTLENNDYGYFLTAFYPSISPNHYVLNNIIIKNPQRAGIALEGISSTALNNIIIYSDTQNSARGVEIWTASGISGTTVMQLSFSNMIFEKIGQAIDLGQGGANQYSIKNSAFTNLSAYDCKGGFWFKNVDSSSSFSNINTYDCAQGGIPGETNYASIRIGPAGTGAVVDYIVLDNIHIVDSGAHGIKCEFLTYVNGGAIVNSTSGVTDSATYLRAKNVVGYVTENSGTGSITAAVTSDIITHGLSYTPVLADISVTLGENPTNTPGAIWVDTIGATYFTVNCENVPGASNLDFSWSVRKV